MCRGGTLLALGPPAPGGLLLFPPGFSFSLFRGLLSGSQPPSRCFICAACSTLKKALLRKRWPRFQLDAISGTESQGGVVALLLYASSKNTAQISQKAGRVTASLNSLTHPLTPGCQVFPMCTVSTAGGLEELTSALGLLINAPRAQSSLGNDSLQESAGYTVHVNNGPCLQVQENKLDWIDAFSKYGVSTQSNRL